MTAHAGKTLTFEVCKEPGCYVWTPHTHIPGVTGVTITQGS